MRITVHVPDEIAKEVQRLAANEQRSVSSVVAQSVEFFIKERNRRRLGRKVLDLAGKTGVTADALEQLHLGREDLGRS
ncbi:MAG: ribbon-helix-helix protein, CopG family [Chloroflexi bacterium]|nr:ribbon-helix-helix protein, CopG family [Chloroflexota bacterium]